MPGSHFVIVHQHVVYTRPVCGSLFTKTESLETRQHILSCSALVMETIRNVSLCTLCSCKGTQCEFFVLLCNCATLALRACNSNSKTTWLRSCVHNREAGGQYRHWRLSYPCPAKQVQGEVKEAKKLFSGECVVWVRIQRYTSSCSQD